jgi:hypothetical protein
LELDPMKWAEQQFGTCELGDARRTRRAVHFAAQIAADPDASTPLQTETWSELKAAYRLIDEEDVTFAALAGGHWKRTRDRSSGTYLILGDTTELDFGMSRQIDGIRPVGNGWGRGFLLHSGLMVDAQTEEVIGLAGQVIRYRQAKPRGENTTQRLQRGRESDIWGEVIEQIGAPRGDAQFIHVFDRGADNFEIFCRVVNCHGDYVIRAAQLTRKLLQEGSELTLEKRLAQLPLAGTYELTVRANKQQPARTAQVEVRFGAVTLKAPAHRSPWLRAAGQRSLAMNVVEVREIKPPRGAQRLRWVLYTSLPVTRFTHAWKVIGYYEKRPLIEEFHKALKTGCRVEERGYHTGSRLEAITGLLSVAAIRLLQLRSVARTQPELPAVEIVPPHWVTMLERLRPKRTIKTVRQFFRELAGLGGFLGRNSDGEPGWITIWRGFEKLQMAVRALHNYRKNCG